MSLLTSLFTEKEIIVMGFIIGGLLFLVIIFTILTILDKRKKENDEIERFQEVMDDKNNLLKENIDNKIEEKAYEQKSTLMSENEKKLVVTLRDVEGNSIKEDIKEVKVREVEPLIMEFEDDIVPIKKEKTFLVETINVEKKDELNAQEELKKVEEELMHPKSLEDTITSLEAMEEENAIISYQELLENTKELNIVEADNGDEPISLHEVISQYNSEKVEQEMTKVSLEDAYQKEFSSSPYLSPIEGVETQNLNEIQLENTANLEKLEKEIRKTNEFLNILNELKKNLE